MAAGREEGLIKLVATDPNEQVERDLGQWRTEMHFPDAAKTDLSLAPYIGFKHGNITLLEDSKLIIYMNAAASDTLDYDDMTSHVNIPVTIYHRTTRHAEQKNLQVADIKLSAAPTTVAGSWVKIGEYTVPKRCIMWLGMPTGTASNPNSRLLIIPMDDTA